MIRTLLRLPSPSWERELATGIDLVDDYLKRIDVTTQTIKIRRWSGLTEIPIGQVVSLDELSAWYRFSPFIFGEGYRLQWLDDQGRQHASLLPLNSELENADRFQTVIHKAPAAPRQARGSASKELPGR
ncbi:MAG: hypothetical protein ACOCVP_06450, partial [Wenzhouxiangella sp.]